MMTFGNITFGTGAFGGIDIPTTPPAGELFAPTLGALAWTHEGLVPGSPDPFAGLLDGDPGWTILSMVLASLFTDARANADDALPTPESDMRGWWADRYTDLESMGSRLWLLHREKMTDDLPGRVEQTARDALSWMVADGHATAVRCAAVRASTDGIALAVQVLRDEGAAVTLVWPSLWDSLRLAA